MGLILFIFIGTGALALVGLAAYTIHRLAPEDHGREAVEAEWPWFARGFAVPAVIWILMNVGLSFQLQPFMPSVQAAQNSGTGWFFTFLGVVAAGLFFIASYWAAVTVGWVLFRVTRELDRDKRSAFRSLCLTCLAGTALPVLWLLWVGGWFTLGLAMLVLGLPIAGYGKAILDKPKHRPMYSRAIARMKFGKYSDAELEIIRQLESAEDDFDGWLMLAELQANQFKDIREAEKIIREICDQPKATPSHISVAMHKLADWQLAVANNPDAADRALRVITSRLPGTHLARMAELRRAQLPRSTRELQEQRQPRHIPLPALTESPDTAEDAPNPAQAAILANQLTAQLTRNPDNVSDREKLARLLAEPLGDPDDAIEQIQLLLGMDQQPDLKRAEWLGLIAAWQLRLKEDEDAARETLERIVREFPGTPQAFAAQRRLSLLKAEAAARKAR